jgi:AcrR family transcriptional regulator
MTTKKTAKTKTVLNPKEKILDAAMTIFSQHGYEGARTRDIAALAQVNISTLHYHFESKDKIYASVIDAINEHSNKIMMPVMIAQHKIIESSDNKTELKEAIKAMAVAFVDKVTDPANRRMVRIIAFEQSEQSKHFKDIFENVMKRVCDPFMLGVAKIMNKRNDSIEVILTTHSLHGVITSFQHNKSSLFHLSGWNGYNETNVKHIKQHVLRIFDIMLAPYMN